MADIEILTGSKYLSYSSFDSLLTCGEKYRLQKVLSVPQSQAWYLLGGSAVHEATEIVDKDPEATPEDAWKTAWDRQLATVADVPLSEIRAGGRQSEKYPDKENKDWWEDHGPQQVAAWATWRDAQIEAGWKLLEVEVPFEIELGGTPVRGFIDRVWVTPTGEVEVHDLKTGSRAPASSVQLATYRHGIRHALGVDALTGRYHMTRQTKAGYEAPPKSLAHFTEKMLGQWYTKAKAIVENELFVPHVGPLCGSCTVAQYCEAFGGTPPTRHPLAK